MNRSRRRRLERHQRVESLTPNHPLMRPPKNKRDLSTYILPQIVMINNISDAQKLPKVEPLRLGNYTYLDHYFDCEKSIIINALCVCHLSRTVKSVAIENISIPDNELADLRFAVKYFRMFGMNISIESGDENVF